MEKSSVVSAKQVIFVLLIVSISFSTAYISSLNAGNSVQDVLPAVPVLFLLNFLVAVPILMLLKRHPGKAIFECFIQIMGKNLSMLIAALYILFFLFHAAAALATYHLVYINAVTVEAQEYEVSIPILIVCVYGAVKGLETIVRFGFFNLILYAVILIFNFIALVPQINLGYLFPMFYNGPGIFLKALESMFNGNIQILLLGVFAAYLRPQDKVGKVYGYSNTLTMSVLFVITLLTIIVMGPFASKQIFPLFTLSQLSKLSVFERLDSVQMVLWILDVILTVTVYLFIIANICSKFGLNHQRKIITALAGAAVYFLAPLISHNYLLYQKLTGGVLMSAVVILLLIVIPMIVLLTDIIKEKVNKNETPA